MNHGHLLHFAPHYIDFIVNWIAIGVTFLFGMLSIVFNWKTAPILPETSSPPSEEVRDT
jgi:hypothetical protein